MLFTLDVHAPLEERTCWLDEIFILLSFFLCSLWEEGSLSKPSFCKRYLHPPTERKLFSLFLIQKNLIWFVLSGRAARDVQRETPVECRDGVIWTSFRLTLISPLTILLDKRAKNSVFVLLSFSLDRMFSVTRSLALGALTVPARFFSYLLLAKMSPRKPSFPLQIGWWFWPKKTLVATFLIGTGDRWLSHGGKDVWNPVKLYSQSPLDRFF